MEAFLATLSDEIAVKVAERLAADLPAPDRLLTVKQTAERAGVSDRTVRAWKAEGKIAYVQVGTGQGGLRFEASEVERFIASRRVAAR